MEKILRRGGQDIVPVGKELVPPNGQIKLQHSSERLLLKCLQNSKTLLVMLPLPQQEISHMVPNRHGGSEAPRLDTEQIHQAGDLVHPMVHDGEVSASGHAVLLLL